MGYGHSGEGGGVSMSGKRYFKKNNFITLTVICKS